MRPPASGSIFVLITFCILCFTSAARVVLAKNPNLSTTDNGARCHFSGICERIPTQAQCSKRARTNPPNSQQLDAVERDAILACEFSPAQRAVRVREAARWTWKGYRDCARGWDELRPLSCTGEEWHKLTLTPVDALDTLLLMDLEEEADQALDVIADNLKLDQSGECNLFETTIRILGGLLAGHHLSEDKHVSRQLLELAVDLGSRLYKGFDSPMGIPYSDINLITGSTAKSVSQSSLSEVATLSLEFSYLSRLSGDPKYENASMTVHEVLTPEVERYHGLLPQYVAPNDGTCSGNVMMLGARSDSYYEYLLKQYIISGGTDEMMLERFVQAMQAIRERLLRRSRQPLVNQTTAVSTSQKGLLFAAEEVRHSGLSPKMDHLVCFLPGVFALADFYNISTQRPNSDDRPDLEIARELAETCYQIYKHTPTGLAPEIVFFRETDDTTGNTQLEIGGGDFTIKPADSHNLLRPETVESLFILHKVTGDPIYQEKAWLIFRAFERWTRVVPGPRQCIQDKTEAFITAASKDAARRASQVAANAIFAGKSVEEAEESGEKAAWMLIDKWQLGNGNRRHKGSLIQVADKLIIAAAKSSAEATAKALYSSSSKVSWWRSKLAALHSIKEEESDEVTQVCGDFSDLRGGGYSNLDSVTQIPPPRRDKMESFWIAETLKYLYLIFSEPPDRCLHNSCRNAPERPAKIPLTKYVFNTEAHPLPILGSKEESFVKVVKGLLLDSGEEGHDEF